MWQLNCTYELMAQGHTVLKKLAVGLCALLFSSLGQEGGGRGGGEKRDIPALTFLAEQITESQPELV